MTDFCSVVRAVLERPLRPVAIKALGFVGGGPSPAPTADALLLETGDALLMESGDALLTDD